MADTKATSSEGQTRSGQCNHANLFKLGGPMYEGKKPVYTCRGCGSQFNTQEAVITVQFGSGQNQPTEAEFVDTSAYDEYHAAKPTEALPDALLTLSGVMAEVHRCTCVDYLDLEDLTINLNTLLAPLVSARVAAALREAAGALQKIADHHSVKETEAGAMEYVDAAIHHHEARVQIEIAINTVLALISAPAQAALDKLLTDERNSTVEMCAVEAERWSLKGAEQGVAEGIRKLKVRR